MMPLPPRDPYFLLRHLLDNDLKDEVITEARSVGHHQNLGPERELSLMKYPSIETLQDLKIAIQSALHGPWRAANRPAWTPLTGDRLFEAIYRDPQWRIEHWTTGDWKVMAGTIGHTKRVGALNGAYLGMDKVEVGKPEGLGIRGEWTPLFRGHFDTKNAVLASWKKLQPYIAKAKAGALTRADLKKVFSEEHEIIEADLWGLEAEPNELALRQALSLRNGEAEYRKLAPKGTGPTQSVFYSPGVAVKMTTALSELGILVDEENFVRHKSLVSEMLRRQPMGRAMVGQVLDQVHLIRINPIAPHSLSHHARPWAFVTAAVVAVVCVALWNAGQPLAAIGGAIGVPLLLYAGFSGS